ncbi:hypothetical protein [Ralstonia solanacearum]|uniref:hypothetical protein n=1 Tax=Ralstonia solanacearum TaxID=305 RepID=UPI0005AC4092|nr:hypothetical protein [Ralstonia solanacearum]MCL9828353.1 hypothetical protein [Ralstonia solanacearum]MCL9833134.1 hypothetical protein [Ralstonia solanacearum]MCL9837915.1 hypothetical protein [Ralstonia solanacearum]MCL9861871.1 hypothetical protein [Ralstonia solanacearum]MCM2263525.1 hypothetical protein [Ralstonia solanacearum]
MAQAALHRVDRHSDLDGRRAEGVAKRVRLQVLRLTHQVGLHLFQVIAYGLGGLIVQLAQAAIAALDPAGCRLRSCLR